MAIGKNKRISKGKKGGKKKVGDAFAKKEWYDLKAPSMFNLTSFGKTLVNKTQGTKTAISGLVGRVYEINFADLHNNDEEQAFRKIKLICEDVQGNVCRCDFYGLDMTRNHLCSLIRKWHTLIETEINMKTSDNFQIRIFTIAFSQRKPNQVKSTCYVKSSKILLIRKRITAVIKKELAGFSLAEIFKKLSINTIAKTIALATHSIFPLHNIFVRKLKVVKRPKFDLPRFLLLHATSKEDEGKAVVQPAEDLVLTENPNAVNLLTAEMNTQVQ